MKKYLPIPYRESNKLLRTYITSFTDKAGNKADITYADYEDKKGKLIIGYVLYVKWK